MEARVWITGTQENPILNFDLPSTRGEKGDPGPPAQLRIGTVATGEPGTEVLASITGEAPDYELNLTIPRGEDGITARTNTPFIVRYRSGAWEYSSIEQAQAEGLTNNQTVWFVGGTAAPSWARPGDIFTQP